MNTKQIKEDYFLISRAMIYAFIIVLIASGMIAGVFFLGYEEGKTRGYNNGWDDANKGIIRVLDNYSSVNLYWANATKVGLKLQKYEEPQYLFSPYPLYEPSDLRMANPNIESKEIGMFCNVNYKTKVNSTFIGCVKE